MQHFIDKCFTIYGKMITFALASQTSAEIYMEITKEIRDRVLSEVKAAAQQKDQYGKQRVPLSVRQEIADRNGVSLSFVTSIVTEAGLTYQRQWKPEERKDIWLNYERLGSKILAERYGVTRRAIMQQIMLMRRVEATTPNPWQRS